MRFARFEVVGHIANDRELVFEFFAVFSRVEYAMKRCGYVRRGRYGQAEPDWRKFESSLAGRLSCSADEVFRKAKEALLAEPPRTQVITETGELEWTETRKPLSESDDAFLLQLVRTVRNNLFHGGKYPYPIGVVADATRNRVVLEAALAVLDQCLAISQPLHEHFSEAA